METKVDDGPAGSPPPTLYDEVVELSTGRVKITIIDDIMAIKVPRGVAVEPKNLPEHLSKHLCSIEYAMRKERIEKLLIPLSLNERIETDIGNAQVFLEQETEKLRTFAFLLFWYCERREQRDRMRGRLTVLYDNQDAVDRQIKDLEVSLLAARQRRAELAAKISAVKADVEKLGADMELSGRPPTSPPRDRESARVPRGRHRKARADK
jgi:hypothetical protein